MNYLNLNIFKSDVDDRFFLQIIHPFFKLSLLICLYFISYICLSQFPFYINVFFLLFLYLLVFLGNRNFKSILFIFLIIIFITFSYSIMYFFIGINNLISVIAITYMRISLIILPIYLYNIITPLKQTVYSFEVLLNPLNRFKIPVNYLILTLSLILNFLSVTITELDRILWMQSMRGWDYKTSNYIGKIKIITRLIIPLLFSIISKSQELAIAIEIRKYPLKKKRTIFNSYPLIKKRT